MNPIPAIIIGVVAVTALVVLAQWWSGRRTIKLHDRFGPEYERLLETIGSKSDAEAELTERVERVDSLELNELSPALCGRFLARWTQVQAHFVVHPRSSVTQAHELVIEVMRARGYPLDDFEHRAADVSVDHPEVVQDYRAAQKIATAEDPSTEELRQAMVHYRALFAELLQVHDERRDHDSVTVNRQPESIDLREERPARYR